MIFALRKDIDTLQFELQKQKEERVRDQQEYDRLREMAGRKDRENSDQDQRIKHADFDLFKLQEKLTEVTKIAELRDFDLKRTNEALSAT